MKLNDDPADELALGDGPDRAGKLRAEIAELNELLRTIWLYVDFRYVTKHLPTRQKNLWADAIDGDETDTGWKVDRCWETANPSTEESRNAH